jgi:DNA segregation ATPase FtsK/SpoIIIE-like protein
MTSETTTDESKSTDTQANETGIPSEWADLSPKLIPLLEQPMEWFQEPVGQYETAFGPFADIDDLTPEAVIFRFTDRIQDYDTDSFELHQQIAEHRDTVYVFNKDSAENQSTPAAWMEMGYPHFSYFERIPFEERVTTLDELENELTEIMDNTPDWEELFDEVSSVAAEIELTESVKP